jgi:hypothetical protein
MGERAAMELVGVTPAPPIAQRIKEFWREINRPPQPKRETTIK